MRESRLRWFGNVQRSASNEPVRKSESIHVEGTKKGRGRPKITLVEVIKKDMSTRGVTKSMNLSRIEWRKRIYMAYKIYFVEDP